MVMRKGEQQAMAVEAVVQVGMSLGRVLDDAVRRAGGLTLNQHHVLAALARAGERGLEPRQIAVAIGSGSAHVTVLLDQLEQAGLVERRPHETDRRRRQVLLTAAGTERVQATSAAVEMAAQGVMARAVGLDPATLMAVAGALDEAIGDMGGPARGDAPAAAGRRPIPGGR